MAGLSAAHELAERGFSVDIYEKRPLALAGGKARSVLVPNSAVGTRRPLPGEHGFRFFPAFYRHLPDTMQRIPGANGNGNVADCLVPTTEGLFAAANETILLPGGGPNLFELPKDSAALHQISELGVSGQELDYFIDRLMVYLTSCDERRYNEWEHVSWWDFVGADTRSSAYQEYMADGMTRSLVAARAREMSARSCASVIWQLLRGFDNPEADRLLNGPTNDVWIHPWTTYLSSLGVRFHDQIEITTLSNEGDRITSVSGRRVPTGAGAAAGGGPGEGDLSITADYYIAALPVDIMAPLVTDGLLAADPSLGGLSTLAEHTRWMNGIQFYLDRQAPVAHGHVIYPDTKFRLTSISQAQFWPNFDFSSVGDGQVKDILSVDISDWTEPGILYGTPANELSPDQVKEEVWAQLMGALNRDGEPKLLDANIHTWYLDDDIVADPPNMSGNLETMLINTVGSWDDRPTAKTAIQNLFLASDYVQTFTDLATMEAANEAARRAVNAILDCETATGDMLDVKACDVWPLHEPAVLWLFRKADAVRYGNDEAHESESEPAVWAAQIAGLP